MEKLESFCNKNVKGTIIRIQCRWHKHGEKCTKYFLNLEKRNHVKKHVRKLNFKSSVTIDPISILLEQMRFIKICTKKSHQGHKVVNSFLDTLDIPKLTKEWLKYNIRARN